MPTYQVEVGGRKFRVQAESPDALPEIVDRIGRETGAIKGETFGPPDPGDVDMESRIARNMQKIQGGTGDSEILGAARAGSNAAARSLGGGQVMAALDAAGRSIGRGFGYDDPKGSFSRDYQAMREAERRLADKQYNENPVASTVGAIGGGALLGNALGGVQGVAPTVMGPTRMGTGPAGNMLTRTLDAGGKAVGRAMAPSQSANVLARIGTTAGQGAAGGAIGAGLAGDDMATGAAWGAGIGGGMSALGETVSGLSRATHGLMDRYRAGPDRADNLIAQAATRDKMTPSSIANKMATRGGYAADAGGENVRGLAESAMIVPNAEKNQAVARLGMRQLGQSDKANREIAKLFGVDPYGYDDAVAKNAARLKKIGDRYYNRSLDKPGYMIDTGEVLDTIDKIARPSGGPSAGAEQSDRVKAILHWERIFGDKNGKPIKMPAREFHENMRSLYEDAQSFFKNNKATTGGDLKAVRDKGLEILGRDKVYARGREMYRDEKNVEEAFEIGRDFIRATGRSSFSDPATIKQMSKAELHAAKVGAARALAQINGSSVDGADRARALIGTPEKRRALEMFFPDAKGDVNKFYTKMLQFERETRTRAQLTGGSRTAVRQAQLDDASMDPEVTMRLVSAAARGDRVAMLEGIMRYAKNRWAGITPQVAADLLKKLTTGDPETVRKVQDTVDRLAQQAAAKVKAGNASVGQRAITAGTVAGQDY